MTYLFMIGVLYIPKVTFGSKLDFQINRVENMRVISVTTQIWSKFTFFIHISFHEKNSLIDIFLRSSFLNSIQLVECEYQIKKLGCLTRYGNTAGIKKQTFLFVVRFVSVMAHFV